jgi:hypothetical protein
MNTNFKAVMADYVPPINKNVFTQSVMMCIRVKMMDSLRGRIDKHPQSTMLPLLLDWLDMFEYYDEMKAALLSGGFLTAPLRENAIAAAFDAKEPWMERPLIRSWMDAVDKATNKWIRECSESVSKSIFSPKDNRRIYVPTMRYHRWVMNYDEMPNWATGGEGELTAEGYERGLLVWRVKYSDAQQLRHYEARQGQATNSPDYFLLIPRGKKTRTLKMFFAGTPFPVGNWLLPPNIPVFSIARILNNDPQAEPGEEWVWEDGDTVEGPEV